ncbi:MAG: YqaJ viral recombinase family protein [Pseudomonadales bacterium]|nr:YqaJ viral recombinase family protein [Pseudomonadales bacterium]
MKVLSGLIQGTPEWLEARKGKRCASDAPAMLGFSKYETRAALMTRYATGISPEVDPATQARFDRGHAAEAAARSIAEEMIGDELFPVTATDDSGEYLASFDGITMLEDVIWENKLMNADLLAFMLVNSDLPDSHWPQVEHQLLVSGAAKAFFTVTDGTVEGTKGIWYSSIPERRAKLIAGWKQFDEDLASHAPRAPDAVVVGRAPESLPALRVEVTGMVTASNLDEFRAAALSVIGRISTDLNTDEDFADAERAVKWCKDVEDRLEAAKQHALSQTASIDALFRTLDEIRDEARQKRLGVDKLVKQRKESIRVEIVTKAQSALRAHCAKLNDRMGGAWMPAIDGGFADAIKNKRTIASLHDAVDTALAHAKIAANELADRIEINRKLLIGDAHDWTFLFPDFGQRCTLELESFAAILSQRIREHEDRQRQAAEARALAERRAAEALAERRAEQPMPAAQEQCPVRAWAGPIEQAEAQAAAVTLIRTAIPPAPDVIEQFLDSREWKSAVARRNAHALLFEFVEFTRNRRATA